MLKGVKGEEIKINNRIDVLDERNTWLEARVVDVLKPFCGCVFFYRFYCID